MKKKGTPERSHDASTWGRRTFSTPSPCPVALKGKKRVQNAKLQLLGGHFEILSVFKENFHDLTLTRRN
jgi:hypothetical protein